MIMKIYHNGKIADKDTLEEIFEPGFLFGWGVFETLRAYNGKVPFLDLHIARLNDALNTLGIEELKTDFKAKINELLKVNNLEDAYIRITAYKKRESTGVLIYADKFGYYPQSAYEKGFSAVISPYRRNIKNNFYTIKSLSYLENRLSWFEAQKQNKDEALVLNEDGFLSGGSRSNLFIVKDQDVITSSIESGAFDGITRKIVISELKKMNISVKEAQISIENLFSCAKEAFLTSALLEAMPLVECGGKKIGDGKPGKVTLNVLEQYRSIL
ncbi:MAG: aminotransferase class IV [Candidatus Omnitrophica bacterium]|jgi:branched-chain amino acid aminotransferase|nr:aminotransferase class IV [Candidatus Omnitrophota bacterium]